MSVHVAEVLDPSLQQTLSSFEAAGVGWVVLRGRAQLAAPGHDIDLLVAGSDLPLVEDIIFALGGVALPRRVHPWHRMYLLPRAGSADLLLDVVTEVVFHRDLRLDSGLEDTVLARGSWDGTARVMEPSDLFWTVMLHCLLDKQAFSPNRRAELTGALPDLVDGSPGERYFSHLAGGVPAAEDVVRLVRDEDWPALVAVGEEVIGRLDPSARVAQPTSSTAPAAPRPTAVRAARTRVRGLLATAYPHLWRRIGLGVTPRAPLAARAAGVPVRVQDIRRRPLVCTSVLRTDAAHVGHLAEALRRDGFVRMGRARYRLVASGVERAVIGTRTSAEDEGGRAVIPVKVMDESPPHPKVGTRPLVVSFSGLDGAGKTRQIDALVEALGADHAVELRWIPFKIWPEGLLTKLPAGFRSRLGPQRKAASSARPQDAGTTSRSTRRTSRRALWWGIGTLAAMSGSLSLRRRVARTSADVLVLDRYRLDAAVKLQFWYPDVSPRWLARVVETLAPAPDAEFLLRVDPEVAYARKPEQWSVEQLARQARLYDGLAHGRAVAVLDAEDDPEQIAARVRAHVRSALDDR